MNDSTIVAKTQPAAPAASSPYSGTPAAIPGQINAETFDNGGEGVAYHDTSAGNAGGQARVGDLWALTPGNGGAGGDPNALYFTAGVQNEAHGLFGSLTPNPARDQTGMTGSGAHSMFG